MIYTVAHELLRELFCVVAIFGIFCVIGFAAIVGILLWDRKHKHEWKDHEEPL